MHCYSIRTEQWYKNLSAQQKEAIKSLMIEIKGEHRKNASIEDHKQTKENI